MSRARALTGVETKGMTMRKSAGKTVIAWMKTGLVLTLLGAAGQFMSGCEETATTAPPVDPDAEIVLLAPQGGERVAVGSALHIRWKLQGKGLEEVNSVEIHVSPDSGGNWVGILDKSIPLGADDWGDYSWTIPESVIRQGVTYPLKGNSRMLVRVKQYTTADANKIAILGKPFTVTAP
jgi:hypothetical protein